MLRRSSRQPATSVSDGDEVTPPASNDYPNDVENVDEDTGQASNDGEDSFELAPDFDAPLALDYRHSRVGFIVRWLKTKFVEVNDSGITTREVGASQLHPNQLNDISVMEELKVAETAISSHRHIKGSKKLAQLLRLTDTSMLNTGNLFRLLILKDDPQGLTSLRRASKLDIARDIALRDTFLSLVHDNNFMQREMRGNFVGLHQTLQDLKSEMDKISRKLDSSYMIDFLFPLTTTKARLSCWIYNKKNKQQVAGKGLEQMFGSVKPKISPIFFTNITGTVNISR
ncbi:hypothetical protein BC829DRAFT_414268 [Chytridium lagenaria]|nr:hypothetical protein BC829DRAFT_414268 [Chytridium lagenaria]